MSLHAIPPELGKSCAECPGPCPIKSVITEGARHFSHGQHRAVNPGAELYSQGDPAKDFYVLLDGWMCLYVLLPDGRRQNIKVAVPGDLLAFDLERGWELDHSAIALTNSVLCPVNRSSFARHAHESPELLESINHYLVRDQALMREHLTSLARRTATERIAHLFFELFVRTRRRAPIDGDRMIMPLTQEQIGDATGLSAVHVCRMLSALRAEGVAYFEDRVFSVGNAQRLEELAGFEAGQLLSSPRGTAAA
jgi:CRP/FNR family transcriptional regulator